MNSGEMEAQDSSTHSTSNFLDGALKLPDVGYSLFPSLNQLS